MLRNNYKKNEDFKLSVLMSVYHKEKPNYLKSAMDSILVEQSQKPDEFVLVVDGPIDEKLNSIIKEYEEKFLGVLRVFRLKDNVGLGKALNYGLNKCRYNLVARADSDDINDRERFKLQLDKFKANSSIDVLGTFIDEFDEEYKFPINKKNASHS